MGDHPPSRQNSTQSLHFESNEGTSAPPNPLSPAAAEEAACIAEDLLTDEWIGVGAHHDSSGLAAWGPTDHIARRCIPVHALGPIRVVLPVFLPRVGGRGDDHSDTNDRGHPSDHMPPPFPSHWPGA